MEIPVYSKEGEKIDNLQLDDKKFGGPIRNKLLRDAVTMYEANKRQGTACTKTRGEVAGGGRKPWVQKHTGRARAGSIRSPLWKGGGVSFGPRPRDYSYAIPKKARKLALYTALSAKVRDNELVVIDNLNFDIPKTKQMVGILKALNIDNSSCLIVIPKANENVWKSARNIPSVKIMTSTELNAYEILRPKKVLLTKEALSSIG
ncbi:MAG: 50S ribosomal protein L4 [Planctomycetes bacterium RIFOXYD2_FULL_41_16]|uniref:50S ribosomal protein L4 n=1 Tax=Candidatus Wunengus californicus TaxID=3367619 RepID=UPI0008B7E6A5|nr:50S ribosomal protein L4 [Planctomycetota bacterium]MBI4221297.1 50S ribosomal protein L4 [Planctomycetota bacterium]OHC06821.1 MAG: 50S ribosomal protein L4 [Planctomycetes bacterium RIFOXYC2_FULL_41_27]OHC08270.1 MAG: 50S ribosomal protein L4 [Planctomycetes bacterium RIFOXYD2_FULL_41_16]OHC15420.1 MAG: 50S ribosomal protein L4 [Planctomycetes bacterium RIFOXYD12_FULL_42_12]